MKNKITLSTTERVSVAAAEKKLVDLKCKLANLVIQQQILCQDVVLAEKDMLARISELAESHGIKKEDAGRWNFDTKTWSFTLR